MNSSSSKDTLVFNQSSVSVSNEPSVSVSNKLSMVEAKEFSPRVKDGKICHKWRSNSNFISKRISSTCFFSLNALGVVRNQQNIKYFLEYPEYHRWSYQIGLKKTYEELFEEMLQNQNLTVKAQGKTDMFLFLFVDSDRIHVDKPLLKSLLFEYRQNLKTSPEMDFWTYINNNYQKWLVETVSICFTTKYKTSQSDQENAMVNWIVANSLLLKNSTP